MITVAAKPASNPVQSKNIWNESDMSPKIEEMSKYLNDYSAFQSRL